MGRTSKCLRILAAVGLSGAAALYCGDIAAQSVSPTMPPPNRSITAPAPQRQTAPSPRVNRLPGEKAPQPMVQRVGDGVIAGYVWWDGNTTSHIPAKNCSGLSITVSAGSPSQSSPTLEQFTPIGTYTNNFTYIPNIGTDGVCAFAVHQMPVGQDLQVKLDVSTATAFSPISAPAIAITPIKIINGKCNNLPPAVPSPSVLTSNWWTCGNSAYNVNFALRPSAHMMSSGGGTGNTPASPNARQSLLSSSAPRGMLNGGTAPSGAGGVPAVQSQGGGIQNPGSKVALNPQPLPPGQRLSNADVIKMANGHVPESVILSSVQSSRGNFDLSPSGCSCAAAGARKRTSPERDGRRKCSAVCRRCCRFRRSCQEVGEITSAEVGKQPQNRWCWARNGSRCVGDAQGSEHSSTQGKVSSPSKDAGEQGGNPRAARSGHERENEPAHQHVKCDSTWSGAHDGGWYGPGDWRLGNGSCV